VKKLFEVSYELSFSEKGKREERSGRHLDVSVLTEGDGQQAVYAARREALKPWDEETAPGVISTFVPTCFALIGVKLVRCVDLDDTVKA